MKQMLSTIKSWWKRRNLLHGSTRELVAFENGELGARRRRKIEEHLARCADCRLEADQIRMTFNLFQQSGRLIDPSNNLLREEDISAALTTGLARLRIAIGTYNDSLRAGGGRSPNCSFAETRLGGTLAAELEVYFGVHAAAAMLKNIRHEKPARQDVIGAIEPTLIGFLGREAASAVTLKFALLLDQEQGLGPKSLLPDNKY